MSGLLQSYEPTNRHSNCIFLHTPHPTPHTPYPLPMPAQFTQSRHPLLSAVFLAALLLSACGKKEPAATAQGPPPAAVKLQTVSTATLKDSAEFVGTLEAEERVTLKPQIEGRIERILVANGDRVEQGTVIATLSADQTASQCCQR